MLFDGLDGRVARWTNTESAFGKEYDSLADMVAFGIAPAVLGLSMGRDPHRRSTATSGGQFGWVIAFFYALCAALRLARCHAVSATGDKRYFQGLAESRRLRQWSVLRAGSSRKWREPGLPGLLLAFAVTGYAAALMVSSFSYLSLKQVDVDKRVKYFYLAFVILPMLIMIRWDPPTMLFAMFVSCATYGPVRWWSASCGGRASLALDDIMRMVRCAMPTRSARHRSLGAAKLAGGVRIRRTRGVASGRPRWAPLLSRLSASGGHYASVRPHCTACESVARPARRRYSASAIPGPTG